MEGKWNDLLGAVVGLVRTADREPADEETKRLVETALCRLLDGSAWTDALKSAGDSPVGRPDDSADLEGESGPALAEAIRKKKDEILPDCALCRTPCGRFFDYDADGFWLARPEIRGKKQVILEEIRRLGHLKKREEQEDLVFRALFALGEDWGGDWLDAIVDELKAVK